MKHSIKSFAVLTRPPHTYQGRVLKAGEVFQVRVMARAEGWAMVRRKGAAPFVVEERLLSPLGPK